jgi:opacity protein-like surface antigen
MKLKIFTYALFVITAFYNTVFSQYNGNDFAVSFSYRYTTTSKIFLEPNSPDPFLRRTNTPLDDLFSYAGEIKYRLIESMIIGLNVESIKRTESVDIRSFGFQVSEEVNAEDGFRVIPIEFTIYYHLPFSTDHWKFYMGGGVGYYWGDYIRNFNGISVSNEERDFAYGIQVAIGMDYMINEFSSLKFEMRFRDPEIEMKSKYSADTFTVNGRIIRIRRDTFISKINIDGATFSLGVAMHF